MSTGFNIDSRKSDPEKIAQNVANTYNYIWDKTKKPPSLEGTKYNRYGTRESGIGSMLDSAIVERNIKREQENLGDGFVQLAIVGDDKKKVSPSM